MKESRKIMFLIFLIFSHSYALSTSPTVLESLGFYEGKQEITQDKVNCYLGLNEFAKIRFANYEVLMYILNFNQFIGNNNLANFPKIPSLLKWKILDDEYLVESLKKSQYLLSYCLNLSQNKILDISQFKYVAEYMIEQKQKHPKTFVNYRIIELNPHKTEGFFSKTAQKIIESPKNFRNTIWKKLSKSSDIELQEKPERIRIPNGGYILEPKFFEDSIIIDFGSLCKLGQKLEKDILKDEDRKKIRDIIYPIFNQKRLGIRDIMVNILFSYAFYDSNYMREYQKLKSNTNKGNKETLTKGKV